MDDYGVRYMSAEEILDRAREEIENQVSSSIRSLDMSGLQPFTSGSGTITKFTHFATNFTNVDTEPTPGSYLHYQSPTKFTVRDAYIFTDTNRTYQVVETIYIDQDVLFAEENFAPIISPDYSTCVVESNIEYLPNAFANNIVINDTNEIADNINNLFHHTAIAIDNAQAQIDELSSFLFTDITNNEQGFIDYILGQMENDFRLTNNRINDTNSHINTQIANTNQRINNQIDSIYAELSQRITDLSTLLDKRTNNIYIYIDNEIDLVRQTIDKNVDELSENISDVYDDLLNELDVTVYPEIAAVENLTNRNRTELISLIESLRISQTNETNTIRNSVETLNELVGALFDNPILLLQRIDLLLRSGAIRYRQILGRIFNQTINKS